MSTIMNGKTVLITGGTGGIGKQTAIGLAELGATVVVTGRDRARGEAGVRAIQDQSKSADVHLLLGDLSSIAAIHGLAEEVEARHKRLDVLINNAGLLESKRRLTLDGIEAHFAVNVLAPYLLTQLLLPVLKAAAPARVVNVTGGMPIGSLDPDNLQAEKSFRGLETYSRAKMAMTAMSLKMARDLEGTGVTVNVVYPGGAATAMTGGMTPDMVPGWMRLIWPLFASRTQDDGGASAAKAARSSIFAASDPSLADVTGAYFDTNSKRAKPNASITNEVNQQQVWRMLDQLTQPTYVQTHPQPAQAQFVRA